MTSAEKFEILSAYLDNEASKEDCLLVEQWLETNPQFRQQYQAQLKLRAAIRALPSSFFDGFFDETNASLRTPVENNPTDGKASEGKTDISSDASKCLSEPGLGGDASSCFLLQVPTDAATSSRDRAKLPLGPTFNPTFNGAISSYSRPAKDTARSLTQFKWKEALIVAAALSDTTITALCFSSVDGSRLVQPGRPNQVREGDVYILPEKRLLVFSPQ